MKSLKERLEQKIEIEAEYRSKCCYYYDSETINACKETAASLVPLVVELAGALDWYSRGDRKYDLITKRAIKALQSIENFLEGK